VTSDRITHLRHIRADTEVTAALQVHEVAHTGERLKLHVDMNRAVLIDPETELVL